MVVYGEGGIKLEVAMEYSSFYSLWQAVNVRQTGTARSGRYLSLRTDAQLGVACLQRLVDDKCSGQLRQRNPLSILAEINDGVTQKFPRLRPACVKHDVIRCEAVANRPCPLNALRFDRTRPPSGFSHPGETEDTV